MTPQSVLTPEMQQQQGMQPQVMQAQAMQTQGGTQGRTGLLPQGMHHLVQPQQQQAMMMLSPHGTMPPHSSALGQTQHQSMPPPPVMSLRPGMQQPRPQQIQQGVSGELSLPHSGPENFHLRPMMNQPLRLNTLINVHMQDEGAYRRGELGRGGPPPNHDDQQVYVAPSGPGGPPGQHYSSPPGSRANSVGISASFSGVGTSGSLSVQFMSHAPHHGLSRLPTAAAAQQHSSSVNMNMHSGQTHHGYDSFPINKFDAGNAGGQPPRGMGWASSSSGPSDQHSPTSQQRPPAQRAGPSKSLGPSARYY